MINKKNNQSWACPNCREQSKLTKKCEECGVKCCTSCSIVEDKKMICIDCYTSTVITRKIATDYFSYIGATNE